MSGGRAGAERGSVLVFQWDLVCEQRGLNQATATFFFIGVTVGAMLFGYLSDRSDPPCGNSTGPRPPGGSQRGREGEEAMAGGGSASRYRIPAIPGSRAGRKGSWIRESGSRERIPEPRLGVGC